MKNSLLLKSLLVFWLLNNTILAQNSKVVDSLLLELEKSKNYVSFIAAKKDTVHIDLLLKIGDQLRNTYPDSALSFYNEGLLIANKINSSKYHAKCLNGIGVINMILGNYDSAINNFEKAIYITDSINEQSLKGSCLNNIGIVYASQGNNDKAVSYFVQAVEIYEKLQNDKYVSYISGNIGIIYSNQGKNEQAIFYYQKILKIAEKIGDKNAMAITYNNIGSIHSDQKSNLLAIEYFKKSLKIHEELGDVRRMSSTYNNLANVYLHEKNYQIANDYYRKSLKIALELDDKRGIAMAYNNIGLVYKDDGKYQKAIDNFKKASDLYEEMEDLGGTAMVLGSLASLYIRLADSTANKTYYNLAIECAERSLKITKEIKLLPMENNMYGKLKTSWEGLGNYKNAYKYSELYIDTRDSLFNEEKTKAIQEMEARYQTEKKQLEIDKLEKEKQLQTEIIARKVAENKKQRILILSFITGLLIIVVFSIFIYRLFLQKKKANILITNQNKIVEQQKKHITDSISYARRIQQAILPSPDLVEDVLGDHFILFQPKDIVSGDFYWATEINGWKIFTVTDCTGHGVPGAFMSMLGLSFLNEIVRKKEVTQPNQILNELRSLIIESLHQKGASGEQQEGMDMAICAIDSATKACHFAGAYNPLYIIRQGNLIEIKGDKMPVAISGKMKEFQNQKIQLETNDCLYLFSDGYIDQFGGEKGRKFMAKSFKTVLIENCHLPMKEQKTILTNTLNEWMNHIDKKTNNPFQQIDDITVVGLMI